MHILEAALISNLRLRPQDKAIATSNSLQNGLSAVMRLLAAVVAIGLGVVSLNSVSSGSAGEGAAVVRIVTGP